MTLPITAHTARGWRIDAIAPDFDVYDVWALPTPGGPDDFPLLVQLFARLDTANIPSWTARTLFAVRDRLGVVFGWDRPETGLGSRVPTLRDRLPEDLRDGPAGPDFDSLPFTPVYLTQDEWVAETANSTVHCVMHLSWVSDGSGGHRGQMAVLVRPNGLLGRAYMAAIGPFRHRLVYPPALRGIERDWQALRTH